LSDLNLRVFARVDDPSPEFFEFLSKKEGVTDPLECWVDINTPRDFEWSDEIGEKASEYGVADDEGTILATFPTIELAEQARSKARVKFSLVMDEDEDARPRGAKAAPAPTVSEMLSSAR
jgi:hypothetical protein